MQEIKIFVSSPGDVQTERGMVSQVIERLQGDYWNFVRLEVVMWEYEATRAIAHFNEEIIAPAECDIVLAFLWARLGSTMPPRFTRADGSRFDSGTEWEVVTSAEAHALQGRPDLMVYRRFEPPPLPEDPARRTEDLAQRAKLQHFWTQWFQHPDGTIRRAFVAYENASELTPRLTAQLRQLIHRRLPASVPAYEVFRPEPLPPGSPFRGLHAFRFEDAPLFFGRGRAIAAIARQFESQAVREDAGPFVVILGGSGSGKSSLARAGVAARLTLADTISGVDAWRRADFHPSAVVGQTPLETLAATLATALPELAAQPAADGQTLDTAGLAKLLADPKRIDALEAPLRAALVTVAAQQAGGEVARLFLVVDQLEELFTDKATTVEGRVAFVRALAFLAGTRQVWIVATMRSEFFARATELPLLRQIMRGDGSLTLLPPDSGEISQIVRYPAAAANLAFERHPQTGESLADAIHAEATSDARALPLLEFLLQDLYEHRDTNNVLLWARYEEVGRLSGALVNHADAAYALLREGSERDALDRIFLALVTIDDRDQAVPTRNRAPRAALERIEGGARALEVFIDARLFVTDSEAAVPVVSLAHEALLVHWPYLQAFVQKHAALLRARRRLADLCNRWSAKAAQDPKGAARLLLEEGSLAEAQEVVRFNPPDLTDAEREFVARSTAKAQTRLRRLRIAVGVFAVLALAATVAGVVAWQQRQKAVEQTGLAQKREGEAVEANNKAKAQIHQACLSDLAAARGLLAKDDWAGSLPYLHRAQLYDDPLNQIASSWLRDGIVYDHHRYDPLPEFLLPADIDVRDAVFSPDGTRLLTACGDHYVRQWDTATGKPIGTPMPQPGAVTTIAYSPDGRSILTGCEVGDGNNRADEVWLWTADNCLPHGEIMREPGKLVSAAFDPFGQHVLTVHNLTIQPPAPPKADPPPDVPRDGKSPTAAELFGQLKFDAPKAPPVVKGVVRVWDAETGEAISGELRHPGDAAIYAAHFNLSGDTVFTAGADGSIRAFVPMESVVAEHVEGLENALFNDDGSEILTFKGDTAQIRRTSPQNPVVTLPHKANVVTAAFSPDGAMVVTASADRNVTPWAVATGKSGVPWEHGDVSRLDFSADSTSYLVTVQGNVLLDSLYDIDFCKERLLRDCTVSRAVCSPDNRRLFLFSAQGAGVWRFPAPRLEAEPIRQQGFSGDIYTAAFSADGKRFITGGKGADCSSGGAQVWDTATSRPVTDFLKHHNDVVGVALNGDGSLAATVCQDDYSRHETVLRLWDTRTGKLATEPIPHPDFIEQVAFSPDGRRILTAGHDGFARQWDVATGLPAGEPLHHAGAVFSAVYSRDGRQILTASEDGTARRWETETGHELGEPLQHPDAVNSAIFSPGGGQILTACKDGAARLWEVGTKQTSGREMRLGDEVLSVAFSPDGQRLAATSFQERTRPGTSEAQVWDTATCLPRGERIQLPGKIQHVDFSPDGNRVLTQSGRGSDATKKLFSGIESHAALWDAATGKAIGTPLPKAWCAVFDPAGSRVLLGMGEASFQEYSPAVLPPSGPWLGEFVEMVAGRRLDEKGDLLTLTIPERLARRETIRALLVAASTSGAPVANSWEQLADWMLTPPTERRLSPNDAHRLGDIVEHVLSDLENCSLTDVKLQAKDYPFIYLHSDSAFQQEFGLDHLPPGDADLHARAAAVLLKHGPPQLASRAARETLLLTPQNIAVKRIFAESQTALNNTSNALKTYKEIIASPEANAQDFARAAALQRKLNQPGPALELARASVDRDPTGVEGLSQLAHCLAGLKRADEAIDAYEKLIAHPEAAVADLAAAAYYAAKLKREDVARAALQAIGERSSDGGSSVLQRGWTLIDLDDPDGAVAAFEACKKNWVFEGENPSEDLLAGLAVSHWLVGEREKALDYYRSLVARKPSYGDPAQINALDWTEAEKAPLLACCVANQRPAPAEKPNGAPVRPPHRR